MNKNYNSRAGFEVSRGGYRRNLYATPACRCTGDNASYKIRQSRPDPTDDRCKEKADGAGCGTNVNSRYGLHDRPLASVYAPLQDFDGLYDLEHALSRGTLFSSLDLPLEVASKGGRCRG